MIPGQLIATGQLTDPGVNFDSVHGLTPVTVHMSFSLPPGSSIYRRRSCLMLITFDQPLFELFTLLLCGQSQLFKVETYCSRTGAYCYGVKTYYNQQ